MTMSGRRLRSGTFGALRVGAILTIPLLLQGAGQPTVTYAQQAPAATADHGGGAHAFLTPELLRRRQPPAAPAAAAGAAGAIGEQGENSSQGPLLYHGGPVMRNPTTYVVIWNPPGSTFSATYQQLIEQFFTDVGGTPYMNINSQWGDSTGAPVPNTTHFGGTWVDTANAYPHAGTVADPVVGQDIRDEVDRAIAANPTWQAPGLSTMYFVYLGQNIIECFQGSGSTFGCFAGTDAGGNSPPAPSGNPNTVAGAGTYCAYHSSFGAKVYATMPYASLGSCYGSPSQFPNGVDQDIVLSPTSHEMVEAFSDPNLDAWYDANGSENGDKCAYVYGQVEPDGTNFVLSGHRYQLQEEWSNALTYGCIKRAGPAAGLAIVGDGTFGLVPRGDTDERDLVIMNLAEGDLNLLNVRFAPGASSAFSIEPTSPKWGTLHPSDSAIVKVKFSPNPAATSAGPLSTSLIVDTDQIGFETQSLAVSGTIGLPKAVLSGSLNFGVVCSGNPDDQFVTVTNTGLAPLTITNVAIAGGSTPGLSVLTPPTLPQTLPVGESLTFTIRFTAGSSAGAISGSVLVTTNDPVNPVLSMPISGSTGAAHVTISSSVLDFGGVATDNRTAPHTADRTVTIGDTGSCGLSALSLAITGPNAGDFSIVGAPALPIAIGSGSSLTLTVRFNPSAPGPRGPAVLTIGTDDPVNPSTPVTLTGLGLIPAIQTSAPNLMYGPTVIASQAPGYPGQTKDLTVTNVGQAELIVDSMVAGAPFSAPGAANPPARFAPSDHFNEPVTFAPTAVGRFTGNLTVSDANAEGPVSKIVPLCGEGVMRGIRVLAVDGNGVPAPMISKLHLQAHGTAQNVNVNVMNLPLTAVPTSCDPDARKQYENQALPSAGTANQRSSYYTLAVTAGGKSTTVTFTLDVAEFKTIVVTIK